MPDMNEADLVAVFVADDVLFVADGPVVPVRLLRDSASTAASSIGCLVERLSCSWTANVSTTFTAARPVVRSRLLLALGLALQALAGRRGILVTPCRPGGP